MTGPPWEVADILRRAGDKFLPRYHGSRTWAQLKVLRAMERGRTAALGGRREQCVRCGPPAISYHSCRNRHGPKCQTNAREKWLCARRPALWPVCYCPLVFSVPHALAPWRWQNKKHLFGVWFDARAATLLEVAADPARLGAEIGFLSILHTWGQTRQRPPHIHCVVPGGGRSLDHSRWMRSPPHFFLPVRGLSRVFRGKFVAGWRQALHRNQLAFHGEWQPLANERAFAAFLRALFRQDGVVYAQAPFGGPEHVLQSLARYTHRVAISNHRLLSVEGDQVTFRWKDYAHHRKSRARTLTQEEFLRRWWQHVLPQGLPRIRYCGWLANRRRREWWPLCRSWLAAATPPSASHDSEAAVWRCPACGSAMRVAERLTAQQILREPTHRFGSLDSS